MKKITLFFGLLAFAFMTQARAAESTINFENYEIGTVMPSVGWGDAATSTIAADPAGVNGKSLHLVASNYNSGSRINDLTLEQGKTLADVAKMKVDIYLSTGADMDWKNINFWWGAPGTAFTPNASTGVTTDNPIQTETREIWLTREFTSADMGLKGALLSLSSFDMAIGVNGSSLDLYWDNITFFDAEGKVIKLAGPALSTEAAIISFKIGEVEGVIDADKKITVEMPAGTVVTALTPTIVVSEKATVSPNSGVAQDFTNAVTYTVTAEDGKTTGVYVVTVNVATSTNNPIAGKVIVSKAYFDVLGRLVSENTKGLIIERVIYDDGSSAANKLFKE